MLGAVILLRALLSLLIHYEIKHPRKKKKEEDASADAEKTKLEEVSTPDAPTDGQ